jgi:hypothetical protein
VLGYAAAQKTGYRPGLAGGEDLGRRHVVLRNRDSQPSHPGPGYAALPGDNPIITGPGPSRGITQCYRTTGTPLTITSAAVSPVARLKPPAAGYGFVITLPAADVPALTAVTTTAYHARGAFAISIAGKTWALPRVEALLRGPQLQIPMISRNQALQIQRMLVPSG